MECVICKNGTTRSGFVTRISHKLRKEPNLEVKS